MGGREKPSGRDGKYQGKSGGGKGQSRGAQSLTYKFHPYSTSMGKKYAPYTNVEEKIKLRVSKDLKYPNDIVDSIKAKSLIDMETKVPKLKASTSKNDEEKRLENKEYKMRYELELKEWSKRKSIFEENVNKMHAIIMEDYCTEYMTNKIREDPKYEEEQATDFTKLLKAISGIMYQSADAVHPVWSMAETMGRLLNIRQAQGESLYEYKDRVNQAASAVKAKLGTEIFTGFMRSTERYKNEKDTKAKRAMEENAFEEFTTMCYLRGCDRDKYQSLIDDLRSQYTRENDQYPRTMEKAMTLLSKHRHDNRKNGVTRRNAQQPSVKGDEKLTSFYQGGKACYCCGSSEHMLPDCKKKGTIPKSEWKDPKFYRAKYAKGQQHMQVDVDGDNDNQSNGRYDDEDEALGWSNAHILKEHCNIHTMKGYSLLNKVKKLPKLKDCLLMDSASSLDLIANERFCKNIEKLERPIDIGTNGGDLLIEKKADMYGYGEVNFDEGAIANILSLKNMVLEKGWRVQFDSKHANCFFVHSPRGILKFECDARGMYSYVPGPLRKPTSEEKSIVRKIENDVKETMKGTSFVQTVEENMKGFTDNQQLRAKEARKAYYVLFAPSMRSLQGVIRQNLFDNMPISSEDLRIADKIYGTDISTLRGKSTRPKPEQVRDNWIEIPEEILKNNRRIVLNVDVMYVNDCMFLTSIDETIRFRAAVPLTSRHHEVLYDGMKMVIRKYNNADFVVYLIKCDGEFKPLMEKVEDKLQVFINYANPEEHVPAAERNNRFIQERTRVAYHRLPFKKLNSILIRYLVMAATHTANYFPAKGGLSRFYSPYMILNERRVDWKKMCVCEFGTYVEAYNRTTNTNAPRTIGAIYLRPAANYQEGHEVLDLQTKRVVTRAKVTPLPMTKQVIDIVHLL